MFVLDLIQLLIFLALVFSLVTTFSEIKASNKRKSQRKQQQTLGRVENRQPTRAPSTRNAPQKSRSENRPQRYDDPVFDSNRKRTPASQRRSRPFDQRRNQKREKEPVRPLVSTRSIEKAGSTPPVRQNESRTWDISASKAPPVKRKTASSFSSLKGRQLREAMIYKEILDKPVSLREK